MGSYRAVIELSGEEREELTGWSKSRTLPAGDVFKARLILALADGKSYSAVDGAENVAPNDCALARSLPIEPYRGARRTT